MSFEVALTNVLITLLYIVPGYMICRMKKASADHLSTLSAVLVYVCSPCLTVSSFVSLEFSLENLWNMALFFVATLVLQAAFMAILYALFRRKYQDARYRILTIGAVLGNVGFFGLPVIKALLPDHPEVLCYSAIYGITMNILVFTMGVFCLTQNKKFMTLRAAMLNPTMFGFAIALPLHLLGAKAFMPPVLFNCIQLLGNMTAPLCMLILGIRLATVSLKRLFSRPFVYLISLAKLVAFPLFCFAMVYFLPLPFSFKASLLVLSSTPCASLILNMAEIHHSETELSANCVLVSTLMCFLTIPVLTLLV